MNILKEGGNVFKDAQGQPATRRIEKKDVPATIKWIESVLGIPFEESRWLGSTGKAATSGDLDLAVDQDKHSKEQIASALTQFVRQQGQNPDEWVKKGAEVHLKTPIAGDPRRGFVQTDFMFFSDVDWGTFYYAGGLDSEYKGMFRNVLMSSIAKSQGVKIGSNGMIGRETNQLVANGTDPDYVATVLLGPGHDRNDLKNVETIYKNLEQDPQRDVKLKDFRAYLTSKEMLEPETDIQEGDAHFLARLRDRIVNQGMQPLVETKITVLNEARDPRIPYLEDKVIQKGVRGIDEVLDVINDASEKTSKYVTVKWDGKPAIIFGRKPTGEFVLTDKSGLNAVGYDGQATSVDQIASIMKRRDAADLARGKKVSRDRLVSTYKDIWPYFEAATPKEFRGFVMGDLIYYPQNPYKEVSGNYVFTPNTMEYRIPMNSDLGEKISGTKVGIALHTQLADANANKAPIDFDINKMFIPVDGLMIASPTVKTLQNVIPDPKLVKEIKSIRNTYGKEIDQLLNPNDLRTMKITNLPTLMENFINSLVGTDFSRATPAEFGKWLESHVTPSKFQNIVEYLNSPKSNTTGMSAVFTVWNLLYQLKTDLLRQLDAQQPGQEGWVFASPSGRFKAVSRGAGGFTSANRAKNA